MDENADVEPAAAVPDQSTEVPRRERRGGRHRGRRPLLPQPRRAPRRPPSRTRTRRPAPIRRSGTSTSGRRSRASPPRTASTPARRVDFKIKTTCRNYTHRASTGSVGTAARALASITTVPITVPLPQTQPAPYRDDFTGLVDCGTWHVTASWAVPANAVSGVYMANLVALDGSRLAEPDPVRRPQRWPRRRHPGPDVGLDLPGVQPVRR